MRGISLVTAAATLAVTLAAAAARADTLPGTKTSADRAAWRAILHWPNSCEKDWRLAGDPSGSGIAVWPASGGKLVDVSCYLGAYQGTSMLYLVRARRSSGALTLLIYRDPGSGVPTPSRRKQILGTLTFAPRTGILTVLDKFRGVGDCGIYSTFRLVNDRFAPVEVRAKTACDGKPPFDPRRWPRLPLPRP